MALVRVYPTITLPRLPSNLSLRANLVVRSCNVQLQLQPNDQHKLVLTVKEQLEKEHHSLPVGRMEGMTKI
ncbi:Sec14p-like phosphatidylinositol transfer family protein [Sesbania bispinosa]|nr:Sec14p-like phosphatidylinositol transfer family protein [Sesbania bispinosa]